MYPEMWEYQSLKLGKRVALIRYDATRYGIWGFYRFIRWIKE